jgi:integrase
MSDDLESIHPQEAVDMYLEAKRGDLTEATLQGQKYRLAAFTDWCLEEGIKDLNELSGRDLYGYRIWRREGNGDGRDPVKPVTLRGQLATARSFLRFCGEIEAVPKDLHDKVQLPVLSSGADVSDTTLSPDRTMEILDYLGRYQYASRDHVVVLLLWRTGCRIGGLQGLDLRDLDLDADHSAIEGPAVHFVHRPETETPLKNKEKGNRWNRIGEYVAEVLRDYIDGPRDNVTDEHGREPLITTSHGRPAKTTVRDTLYRVTRPCWRNEGCPHDRSIADCESTDLQHASKCPSSRSPHDLRSGRVTYYRREDVPRRVVKDRLNASEDILDKHYDRRSGRERSEQRSEYLPDL